MNSIQKFFDGYYDDYVDYVKRYKIISRKDIPPKEFFNQQIEILRKKWKAKVFDGNLKVKLAPLTCEPSPGCINYGKFKFKKLNAIFYLDGGALIIKLESNYEYGHPSWGEYSSIYDVCLGEYGTSAYKMLYKLNFDGLLTYLKFFLSTYSNDSNIEEFLDVPDDY